MSLIWKAGSICATTALVMIAASTVPSRMPSSSGFSSPSARLGNSCTSIRPLDSASTACLKARAPMA